MPPPSAALPFEDAIRAMAKHLGEQVAATDQGLLATLRGLVVSRQRKLVIDPFIDYESGSVLKNNERLAEFVAQSVGAPLTSLGLLRHTTYPSADVVLTGIFSLAEKGAKSPSYKAYATIFVKATGRVLASSTATIRGLDLTPLQASQDSPVFTRGTNFEYQVRTAQLQPPQQVEPLYLQYLATKATLGSGLLSYESGDYQTAAQQFNEALQGKEDTLLEALGLNFAVYVKFGRYQQAEDLFARLLRRTVEETHACQVKFVFAVNAPQPVSNPTLQQLYDIYIRQLAAYLEESARCQLRILGHSSRSGSETYNDELSTQRAQWLQQALLQQRPSITQKLAAEGRGFRDNVVGTGADDITDQIDRRVEFQFLGCKATPAR